MTSQINAENLAALEVIKFPGKIVTVNTENEAYTAAESLMNETVVGIDTETRPLSEKVSCTTLPSCKYRHGIHATCSEYAE